MNNNKFHVSKFPPSWDQEYNPHWLLRADDKSECVEDYIGLARPHCDQLTWTQVTCAVNLARPHRGQLAWTQGTCAYNMSTLWSVNMDQGHVCCKPCTSALWSANTDPGHLGSRGDREVCLQNISKAGMITNDCKCEMVSEGETKKQGNFIYIEDGTTTGRWTMDPVVLSVAIRA